MAKSRCKITLLRVPTLYLATELRDHFLFVFFNALPLNNLGTHEKLITFAIGF